MAPPCSPWASPNPRALGRIWLTFVEATIGLGLVALLISYLPTIYSAHHQREKGIIVLRPFAGTPPSPVDLLVNLHRLGSLDTPDLWRTTTSWLLELDQTHTAFPALCYFPESSADQSWVASVGSVLDAAALLLSTMDFAADKGAADDVKGPMMALAYGMPSLVRIGMSAGTSHQARRTPLLGSAGPGQDGPPPISVRREEYLAALDRLQPVPPRSRVGVESSAGDGSPGSAPATTRPCADWPASPWHRRRNGPPTGRPRSAGRDVLLRPYLDWALDAPT